MQGGRRQAGSLIYKWTWAFGVRPAVKDRMGIVHFRYLVEQTRAHNPKRGPIEHAHPQKENTNIPLLSSKTIPKQLFVQSTYSSSVRMTLPSREYVRLWV